MAIKLKTKNDKLTNPFSNAPVIFMEEDEVKTVLPKERHANFNEVLFKDINKNLWRASLTKFAKAVRPEYANELVNALDEFGNQPIGLVVEVLSDRVAEDPEQTKKEWLQYLESHSDVMLVRDAAELIDESLVYTDRNWNGIYTPASDTDQWIAVKSEIPGKFKKYSTYKHLDATTGNYYIRGNVIVDGIRYQPLFHKLKAFCKLNDDRAMAYGYNVDHIDNNSLNNALDNLQILTEAEHQKKTLQARFNKILGAKKLDVKDAVDDVYILTKDNYRPVTKEQALKYGETNGTAQIFKVNKKEFMALVKQAREALIENPNKWAFHRLHGAGKSNIMDAELKSRYEIQLGTFINDEFNWHSVKEYDDLTDAYIGFKKYVNSQLKYTDEELKKVWETGRLDIELRQGNKLLNWVGIYAREVAPLTEEEEKRAEK